MTCSTNILSLFAMVCLVICTTRNLSCNMDVHHSIVCRGRGPLNAFHLGTNKENMVYTNRGMLHNN